jgi:hypothetical protein
MNDPTQLSDNGAVWALDSNISYLIIEKMDGMGIQFQRQSLKK